MLGWFSRCWGGFGVNSQFQRARMRSVITDWRVPEDADLCVLITSFKGQNPEIPAETALEMFLTHMQVDDEKSNPIFLLKHLFILDQTVQERTGLEKISSYYSSQFFNFKTGENIEISPIRQLVAAYSIYIKKKAEVYLNVDESVFKKEGRIKAVESMTTSQIFALVQRCLEVQKPILEINVKFKGRNKTAELIQIIFTMLLKSYLFCYTLVSTCSKILFKRLQKLTKHELVRMYRFVLYFNKEYTRNFVDFIESNKDLAIYRTIKYSQIILIDKVYIKYLQNYVKNAEIEPATALSNNSVKAEEEILNSLPEEIFRSLAEDIRVAHQPRKDFKIEPRKYSQKQFYDLINLYSNDYESELQSSLRNAYNAQQQRHKELFVDSKIFKSKKSQYEFVAIPVKFSEAVWNEWKNVYAF